MDFEYFDIHSHMRFPEYDSDREDIISEMKKNKIASITVGVDFETSKKELEFAEKHENLWVSVGQHPENLSGGFDERIGELAENPKVVARSEM